jgi:hypothetical protein
LKITNAKAYDICKFVALVVLPGLATLYGGLSLIWGLPDSAQVIATLTVIDAFLGSLVHVSVPKQPVGGIVTIDNQAGSAKINLLHDWEELLNMGKAVFHIESGSNGSSS